MIGIGIGIPYKGAHGGARGYTTKNSWLFDGGNEGMNHGSDASIDDIWAGGGTFTTWIRISGIDNDRIVDKTGGVSSGWQIFPTDLSGSDFTLGFGHYWNGLFAQWRPDGRPLTLNTYYNILATYDSDSTANNPTWYINGSLVASTESGAAPGGSINEDVGNDLFLGNNINSDRGLDGYMTETGLFDTMFTTDQALEVYSGGSPDSLLNHSASANLVLWNKGGEGATFGGGNWSIPDDSTNSNTGTSVNMEEGDRTTVIPT